MSSAGAADGTNTSRGSIATVSIGAGAGAVDTTTTTSSSRQASTTFWCHECDMSMTLRFSSPSLVCPQCRGGFLEEMEHPPPQLRPHSQTLTLPHSDHHRDVDVDDLFYSHYTNDLSSGRSSPEIIYNFDRFIGHIVSTASDGHDDPTLDDSVGDGGSRPASKSSVEAIPTVKITATLLAADPFLLCAVCKDEFALNSEARQLPCSHIYHPDCILPWLSQHNSCPVCRFRLPTDDQDRRRRPGRADLSSVVFGNLIEEDEEYGDEEVLLRDVHEIHRVVSHILRRHRSVFSERSPELSVPTQMAQAEVGSDGPANSVGTVPPECSGGGIGSGDRVDNEGDVVMSEFRGSLHD